MAFCFRLLSLGFVAGMVAFSSQAIETTNFWHDLDGNIITNQSDSLLKVGDTYYWYGYDVRQSFDITCYTSTNLEQWKRNVVYPGHGWGCSAFPCVHFNTNTGEYVMITAGNVRTHGAPRGANAIKYWTAPSPLGPFTSVRQDDNAFGIYQLGGSFYEDTDGTGYFVCSSFDDSPRPHQNTWIRILKLGPNYTNLVSTVAVFKSYSDGGTHREAPAILKVGQRYYIFTSHTSGYGGSATGYVLATNLAGPWSPLAIVKTVPASSNSYDTQTFFEWENAGRAATTYFYGGDRWCKFVTNLVGLQGWYPLTFDGDGAPTMHGYTNWTIDTVGGGWWSSDNHGGVIPDGVYHIVKKENQAVLNASAAANGTVIDQKPCTNGAGQVWYLFHQGGNRYEIQGLQSGRVLCSVDNSTLVLADWSASSNQQWKITPQGEGYYSIANVQNGLPMNDLWQFRKP